MRAFEILAKGPYTLDHVHVSYTPGAGRPADDADDLHIAEAWRAAQDRARAANVPLFDGRLYRLTTFHVRHDRLHLDLGDTSYKEYVGTRSQQFSHKHGRDAHANPLGVCAAIVTADDRILVERRQRSDVYRGRLHVIGGFCDREQDGGPGGPMPFLAIAREIREEVGLDVAPGDLLCLGLVYDRVTPHPELCFATHTQLTFSAIERLIPSLGEIDQIESVAADPLQLSTFLQTSRGNISITGQACLVQYGGWRFGAEWRAALVAQL